MSQALTQAEANGMLDMEKHYTGEDGFGFPSLGGSLRIPLFSPDGREEFSLDISRSRVLLEKNTFQNRACKTVVLARLDFGGPPHRNPDDAEVPSPHLHLYREGFGDKWAYPLPTDFSGVNGTGQLLTVFMDYCHVVTKPNIVGDLFT